MLTAVVLLLTMLPLSAGAGEEEHCWSHGAGTVVDEDGAEVDDAAADRTDIVEHCVTYDTQEMSFAVRVAAPQDPRDDPAWEEDFTRVRWHVQQDGGSGQDLIVVFHRIDEHLQATIATSDGRVCDGVGELRDDLTVARFPGHCLEGDPDLRVRAEATYQTEQDGDIWFDHAPGDGEHTPPVEKHLEIPDRFSGADRYETAARVSAAYFDPGVEVAYVATGSDYPDALAGGVLAARDGGPVLLVAHDRIPVDTLLELQRLEPRRIVALGGGAVIGDAVMDQLDGLAESVSRLAGGNRFATAAEISRSAFGPDPDLHTTAFVATGANFADALSGVPPAALHGGPILLATRDDLPQVTQDELARLELQTIFVLGGAAAISTTVEAQLAAFAPDVIRLAGDDRFETSVVVGDLVIGQDQPDDLTVFVATGEDYPDALAAGAVGGQIRAPIYLVGHDHAPPALRAELERLQPEQLSVLGGEGAVSAQVERQLREAAGLPTDLPR